MAEDDTFKREHPDCDLYLYFSQSQLNNMSLFEKLVAYNKMKNYFVCLSLDLYCEMPEFMKKTGDIVTIKQESPRRTFKLSDDVKKTLQFSEIPSSYIVKNEQGEVESEQCLELPLCKNEKHLKLIWNNLNSIAPAAITEMEGNYNMKRKALEKFKSHGIGMAELQLFFVNNIDRLDAAMENLSLQEENLSKGRYAFRKLARRDSCKIENIWSIDDTSESNKSVTQVDWYLPKSFAAKTLPDGLTLKPSKLLSGVPGVFTTRKIKMEIIFGPYVGARLQSGDVTKVSGRYWEIFVNGLLHHYVDGEDPEQSNWMRYINHATSPQLQNLESFQFHYKIYYKTMIDIPADTELLVWYSEDYNQDESSERKSLTNARSINVESESIESKTEHGNDKFLEGGTNNNDILEIPDFDVDFSSLGDIFSEFQSTSFQGNCLRDYSEVHGVTHECDVCFVSFTEEAKFKEHLKIHMNDGPYKCDVCLVSFKRLCQLNDHERLHAVARPHKCHACGDSFKLMACLVEHVREHKVEGPHACHLCGALFTHASTLENHFGVHEIEQYNKCDLCESSFSLFTDLKVHTRSHELEKPYKCKFCGITYEYRFQLMHHMRVHTGERPHKCFMCKGSFRCRHNLRVHVERLHSFEKPYGCDKCDAMFKSKDQLKHHIIGRHTDERPYECRLCESSFKFKAHLLRHMRIHSRNKQNKCETCGISFQNSANHASHREFHLMKKSHEPNSEISTFEPDQASSSKSTKRCSSSFKKSQQVKDHTTVPEEKRPHKCEVCGVLFKRNQNLKYHIRTHAKKRIYKCDMCSIPFKNKRDLKAHKELHTSDKFFKCDICSATFSCSSYLEIHTRVHSTDRPFKCSRCKASFESKDHLEGHVKIHQTNLKLYKCGSCNTSFSLYSQLKLHNKVHE